MDGSFHYRLSGRILGDKTRDWARCKRDQILQRKLVHSKPQEPKKLFDPSMRRDLERDENYVWMNGIVRYVM
jgi:hypothetical protein